MPSQIEPWDSSEPLGTERMVKQVKIAVFCELREAVELARLRRSDISYRGKSITTTEDLPLPDTWGVQTTLTLTVDEETNVTPGLGLSSVDKTFALGLGGTISSQAVRVDKYDTFYSIKDVIDVRGDQQICDPVEREKQSQPRSSSSPFLVLSRVGIREWLPEAYAASRFIRSSRESPLGIGPPLTSGSFASDSISYDIKFVIEANASGTPIWTLRRVSSESTVRLSRTKTHQLLVTIGPAEVLKIQGKKGVQLQVVGPSQSATNSHLAQQIGDAVAQSLRTLPVPRQMFASTRIAQLSRQKRLRSQQTP